MPKFEVQVRLFDVDEENASVACRAVEDRLNGAGFNRRRIVGVRHMGARPNPPRPRARPAPRFAVRRRREPNIGGVLLVAAAVAWWLSVLWAIE